MAKTTYRTWVTGELVSSAMLNEQIKQNGDAIWVGTTAGDIDYYSSSTEKTRIGIGTENKLLACKSGVPAWDSYVGAGIYRTTTQSIGTGTDTNITSFDSVFYDSNGFFTSGSAFVVPANYGGVYYIQAKGYFDGHATDATLREIGIKVNGTVRMKASFVQDIDANATWMETNLIRLISPGDSIGMSVLQRSGGNLNINQPALTVMLMR